MKHKTVISALLCSAFWPTAAFAQQIAVSDPEQPSPEIIVTAQKRAERLSEVPMSIAALSGDQLQSQGIREISDLAKVVPGFAFQPSDFGTPVYTIRGVGQKDNSATIFPTVSIYSDQVPIPYSVMTLGAAFDVERVEVLKGPQGTLFGQNSTGGAINFIPSRATDTTQAEGQLTYGRFNQIDAQAWLSGPLANGLKARIAVRTEQRDPWQRSQTRSDALGRRDFTTGRFRLVSRI